MFEDIIKKYIEPEIHNLQRCVVPPDTLWTDAWKYCPYYKAFDKNDGRVYCKFFDNAYTCSKEG